MTSTLAAEAPPASAYEREECVRQIVHHAERWRLLDCSEATVERMRSVVDHEMIELERELGEADERFFSFVQAGNPTSADHTLERIEYLSSEWERRKERLREIDNALQEIRLRGRLIALLGSEMRLNVLDGVVLVSILVVVLMTLVEMFVPGLAPDVVNAITLFDTVICVFLIADFGLRLWLSADRRWYVRRYWIDLISSIPFYAALRFGRLIRIARFVRLLRLLRLARALRLLLFLFRGLDKLTKTFEINLLKRALFLAVGLLIFGALAISALEGPQDASIQNFGESLWWSFSTVVTGGFADLYNPSTTTGRVVTVGMILLGLTVTGIFTASLTSVLVEDDSTRLEQNQHRFEERLGSVQHKLDLLTGETNQALIALEAVAQAVSNERSHQALAALLVRSLTTDFYGLQASVHLLDTDAMLVRLAHAGLDQLEPPGRIAPGEGFLGELVEELREKDMRHIDLEPRTMPCTEVQGMILACPMAAGGKLCGVVQVVLPAHLADDYLYTRLPMALAHHVAMAFYTIEVEGGSQPAGEERPGC